MTGDDDEFSVDFFWDERDGWSYWSTFWIDAPGHEAVSRALIALCEALDDMKIRPESLRGTPE